MKKIYLAFLLFIIVFYGCESSILDDPYTTIKYSVPEQCHVKLTIENSYNTVIATLVDKDLAPGNYQVGFDSSELAEGIYFYTLESRGTESSFYSKITKSMVLVKP